MANELTLQLSMNFAKSLITANKALTKQLTVAGEDYVMATQNIGTSEETLGKGSITTMGYLLIHNMDATNFVEVGAVTAQYGIKLLAGEFAVFRVNGSDVFCKANTLACDVQYLLIEA
jgi:hypothetical protein